MVFSSLTFLALFLPIVLLLYFVRGSLKWRNGVLLIASLLFYSWGEPVWVLLMIGSVTINYACAMMIDRSTSTLTRRLYLTVGVIVSVAALFYFKYAAFFFNTFTGLFGMELRLPVLELPLGISFYTFQVLTYTVDVYLRKSPVQKRFSDLMLYVSCFPQLIAGPIVQYTDIAEQLSVRTSTADDFTAGLKRFAVGLSKKVLIADICGAIIELLPMADSGQSLTVVGAWYTAVLYSLQLYFDFSGYSDMAIGLGRVLGFRYKENFNYPYVSKSATEFWRRWHISLGSFFREYIYIPLGGNRRGTLRTVLNLMVVWMLTGLWHGASWNFVLWGLYYGVILIIERFVLADIMKKLPGIVTTLTTLMVIIVGWVIFYYTDLSAVGTHLGAMFGIGSSGFADDLTMAVIRKYTVLPLVGVVASLPIVPAVKAKLKPGSALARVSDGAATVLLTVLLALSVLFIIGQSYNAFIYFRF